RVHLGTDHAGLDLKQHLIDHLQARGHEPVDHGAFVYDALDDYPVFCLRAAEAVVADPGSLGVVIGGSGNGEAIAANKVDGARCALLFSEDTARLAREHNDANVASLGARMYDEQHALRFVEVFLSTPFSGDARHVRRIGQLRDYERSREVPSG
ncbi:MAG TPA: ribose-5-phosphate isomerase, partial [Mycobacteriales bacterium]|nr:ribose-5-phosphate isomerase [Mycobacteriales bacterium]